jgi:hypothetical protein
MINCLGSLQEISSLAHFSVLTDNLYLRTPPRISYYLHIKIICSVFSSRKSYLNPVISMEIPTLQQRELAKLAELRLIVGYLGECDPRPWWVSGFTVPSSTPFLTPVFARTLITARFQAISLAAQRIHDQHVGIGEVFHLFRLPDDLEQLLHDAMRAPRDSGINLPGSYEEAIAALESLSASMATKADGPVRVGRLEDVRARRTWVETAGYYLNAFVAGHQVHPYLADR